MADQTIFGSLPFLVARHAPTHRQRSDLDRAFHLLNLTVADLTIHVGLDMPTVRETNVVGKVVHPDPWDRVTLFPVFGEFHDLRLLDGYAAVAADTLLDRGDAGHGAAAGIGVTVLTPDFVVSGVNPVAEGQGLSARLGGLGCLLLRPSVNLPSVNLIDNGRRRDEKYSERRRQVQSDQTRC